MQPRNSGEARIPREHVRIQRAIESRIRRNGEGHGALQGFEDCGEPMQGNPGIEVVHRVKAVVHREPAAERRCGDDPRASRSVAAFETQVLGELDVRVDERGDGERYRPYECGLAVREDRRDDRRDRERPGEEIVPALARRRAARDRCRDDPQHGIGEMTHHERMKEEFASAVQARIVVTKSFLFDVAMMFRVFPPPAAKTHQHRKGEHDAGDAVRPSAAEKRPVDARVRKFEVARIDETEYGDSTPTKHRQRGEAGGPGAEEPECRLFAETTGGEARLLAREVADHRASHAGARFSRNALVPSRKSRVVTRVPNSSASKASASASGRCAPPTIARLQAATASGAREAMTWAMRLASSRSDPAGTTRWTSPMRSASA